MEQQNPLNKRNQAVINWYEKELNKDNKELQVSKREIISSIKTINKEELFKKETKPKLSLWKRILKAILGY